MTYRVKVTGRSARNTAFGVEVYPITSPADVTAIDGVLLIVTPPTEGRKGGDPRKPTRGSQIAYPPGGWDRVVVTDYIDEEAP